MHFLSRWNAHTRASYARESLPTETITERGTVFARAGVSRSRGRYWRASITLAHVRSTISALELVYGTRRLLCLVCSYRQWEIGRNRLISLGNGYEKASGFVMHVHCELCSKHADRLWSFCITIVNLLLIVLQGVLWKRTTLYSILSLTCTKKLSGGPEQWKMYTGLHQ